MRILSSGYFLSAFNALVFIFPTVIFYPVLATYPASIVLRGWGWRSLRSRLGPLGVLYPAIWGLGALTYLALILSFLEIFREGIWVALAAWVVYSILEASLYLRAAGKLRIRLLYASPVSLAGVSAIVASIVMIWGSSKFPSEIRYGDLTPLFFGGAACLVASALITAVAALQIRAEKPTGERELESLLVTLPRYSSAAATQSPQPTQPTARPKGALTAGTSRTALIGLEVVSRSDTLVCLKCGASAPIGAVNCPECGERFRKAASGLRCPVCEAPFSIAKPISAGHYVCGQCFSDIRVVRRAS
jgi:hypothetical protein